MAAEMNEDVDIEASSSASDEDLERFENMTHALGWFFSNTVYGSDWIDSCIIVKRSMHEVGFVVDGCVGHVLRGRLHFSQRQHLYCEA